MGEEKNITTFEEWEDIQREEEYEEINGEEQEETEEQDLLF